MKKNTLMILAGLGKGLCGLFLLLFPDDRHTWSARDEISELQSEESVRGLGVRHGGDLWREVVRWRHGWAPPMGGQKLPVDD